MLAQSSFVTIRAYICAAYQVVSKYLYTTAHKKSHCHREANLVVRYTGNKKYVRYSGHRPTAEKQTIVSCDRHLVLEIWLTEWNVGIGFWLKVSK